MQHGKAKFYYPPKASEVITCNNPTCIPVRANVTYADVQIKLEERVIGCRKNYTNNQNKNIIGFKIDPTTNEHIPLCAKGYTLSAISVTENLTFNNSDGTFTKFNVQKALDCVPE